jgi:O-antigen ligase
MTSAAIWQIAVGIVLLLVMLAVAISAKRTISIGALLVLIPFQTIDTKYGSSSILIAYALGGILLISGGLKHRMLPSLGLIVLAYLASFALADRKMLLLNALFMFQFFSCLIVFLLAYNFAILVERDRVVMNVLLVINVLAVVYCLLQLTVGPGEGFVPLGIDELKFNPNRDPGDPRLVGPFASPGSTAGYFALMSLVCVVEYMLSQGRRRFLVGVVTAFNLMGLVATGNRAGFIVLLGMAPLLLFAYRRELGARRVFQYAIGGAAALATVAAIAVTFTDFNRLFDRMETVTAIEGGIPETRQEGWPVAIGKIKKDPWFGRGPHFPTADDTKGTGQIKTEYEDLGTLNTVYDHYPHSLYLYLLRTVGIFGLLAVVGFFMRAWFILLRTPRAGSTEEYALAFTRLGLFLIPAFLISQITLEFHRPSTMDYAQFVFALVGLLVGMSDRVRQAAR